MHWNGSYTQLTRTVMALFVWSGICYSLALDNAFMIDRSPVAFLSRPTLYLSCSSPRICVRLSANTASITSIPQACPEVPSRPMASPSRRDQAVCLRLLSCALRTRRFLGLTLYRSCPNSPGDTRPREELPRPVESLPPRTRRFHAR